MPKLTVGNTNSLKNGMQPLSIQGVAEQTASGARIGRVQQEQGPQAILAGVQMGDTQQLSGEWLASNGNKMMANGYDALQEAMFNIASTQSVDEYNNQATQVAANNYPKIDSVLANFAKKNGNKVYPTDVTNTDLDKLTSDIYGKYSQGMDPIRQKKFAESLNAHNTSYKVKVSQKGRADLVDTSKKALDKYLNTQIKMGIQDGRENLGLYAQQGYDAITAGVKNGMLSEEDAQTYAEKLRSGLYRGSLQLENQTSPGTAAQRLSKGYKDLNVNPQEYKELMAQNRQAWKDIEQKNKELDKQQQEIEHRNQVYTNYQLEDGIESGEVTKTTVIDEYAKGNISPDQFERLMKKGRERDTKVLKTLDGRARMTNDILRGEMLSGYKPQEINDHYNDTIKGMYGEDHKATIMEKAKVAVMYKAPVEDFTNELNYYIKTGDPKAIQEGVEAYNYLLEKNPLSVSKITNDKKNGPFMSALANNFKYGTDDPKAIIEATKETVFNVDNKTKKKREGAFKEESAFSSENIKTTVADMYGGDPWYRGADNVSDGVTEVLSTELHEAYKATGDKNDAINYVKEKTKGLIGTSEVNTKDTWGPDKNTVMLLPPEQAYGNKYTAQEIRTQFNQDIGPIAQANKVNVDDVYIGSDRYTLAQARKGETPSYYAYTKDSQGRDIPILDPSTGVPQRWHMDDNNEKDIYNKKVEASKAAATAKMEQKPLFNHTSFLSKLVATAHQSMSQVIGESSTNPKLKDPKMYAQAVTSNSIPQVSKLYTNNDRNADIIATTLSKTIGKDVNPKSLANGMAVTNSILDGSNPTEEYLKSGSVTNNPSKGDLVVGPDGRPGLFAGKSKRDGETYVQSLSMENDEVNLKEIKLNDAMFRKVASSTYNSLSPEQRMAAERNPQFQSTIKKLYNNIIEKEIQDELEKKLGGGKNRTEYSVYTGKQETYDPKGKLITGQVPLDGTNAQMTNRTASSGEVLEDDPYSVGVKRVVTKSSNANNTGSTWWDSVVNKISKDEVRPPADLEMKNGQLLHPVLNPQTGNYTTNAQEIESVLSNLQQNLNNNVGAGFSPEKQAVIVKFIKSTYSKESISFTDKEQKIINDYINNPNPTKQKTDMEKQSDALDGLEVGKNVSMSQRQALIKFLKAGYTTSKPDLTAEEYDFIKKYLGGRL